MSMGAQMNHMAQNMLLMQLQGNPMFRQAQQMAQGKNPEQLKQTCMNLCRQKGINFDEAWNQFHSQFSGLK